MAVQDVYDLLLDQLSGQQQVQRLVIGLVWTLCQSEQGSGLAMSPTLNTRTLPWSGSLQGKSLQELASWVKDWDGHRAAVGLAAINCCLSQRALPESLELPTPLRNPNLAVFDYFLPQLQGRKVAVIGHYPGIERYREFMQLSVLERQPQDGDLPDSAAETILPQADWVFITASSLVNKTFARLAELSASATSVLMGPSLPWIPHWHEFGIDYLAGTQVHDAELLFHTVAQGGGVRIFQQGLHYRVAALHPEASMNWLRSEIAECAAQRSRLLQDMDEWYRQESHKRFPAYPTLEQVSQRLSRMDSSFKQLWDRYSSGLAQREPQT
jgi:uncharacterized protein